MAEWSNAPHSKCGVRVTVPGVRIPLFPLRTRNHKRKGWSLNDFGLFLFLNDSETILIRFLNDSEYIEGYIIVPRETGTNYRRNISQIKNYGTLKRTETRLHDETIIHSAVCRNPDCHPLCRTYLSTSYRSCSNDSNRNNFLASAHLREQATIEKTDIVKRCPKRERRTPTLFLILTFGSKKFAKRNERILSQHRCSMPSSWRVSCETAISLRILNDTLIVRLSMAWDRVG